TIGGAAAYVLALLMVANLVFLAGLEGAGASGLGPARTGTFGDLQLPAIAAVDAGQIAQALIEAGGGPATIGRRAPDLLPAEVGGSDQRPPVPQAGPQAQTPSSVSSSTTPTYTAATQVSTLSIASLLAQIPLTVTFPPRAHKAGARGR